MPQTSPSPWVAWQSPQEKSPPESLDGQKEGRAGDELADVEVAADTARGDGAVRAWLAGSQAHDATERLEGDDDSRFELGFAGSGQIPVHQVRGLERWVVLEQVESGQDERVAPALRAHLDDVNDQGVARFGAADSDGAADLVDEIEVEVEERVGGRIGGDLATGDLRRLEDDGVTGVDSKGRRCVSVPAVDDGVLIEVMGLWHGVSSLPSATQRIGR